MSRVLKCCIVMSAILFLGVAHGDEPSWKLSKDDDGIQVYSRPVPGSELLEFQAKTIIPANLSVLGAVLADISNYPNWMSNCHEASVIKEVDKETLMVYYVQSLPWPIANRDVVMLATTIVDWDKQCMEVLMQATPDSGVPVHKKKVRMSVFSGRMFFQQLGDKQTEVTFRINADPAGSLPSSGVNAGALIVPFRTLQGMREMAAKEKYIQAAEEYKRIMMEDKG